jgi:hypothetical protein
MHKIWSNCRASDFRRGRGDLEKKFKYFIINKGPSRATDKILLNLFQMLSEKGFFGIFSDQVDCRK